MNKWTLRFHVATEDRHFHFKADAAMITQSLVGIGALAVALFSQGTPAQSVYRCTDAAGKVQISDRMCDNTAVDKARIVVRPNTLESSGERELMLREENARLRQQVSGAHAGVSGPGVGRTGADLQAERSGSYECRQATRNNEVAASSITATHASRQAAAQGMRAACGMREPTQVNVYNPAARNRHVVPHVPVIPPRTPIPSVTGGFFTPAAGGWTSPNGQFCADAAGGMTCSGRFVPIH